jgi:cytochrome b561
VKTVLLSRYHPLLMTLHWLLAVLIVAMLSVGLVLWLKCQTGIRRRSAFWWHIAILRW